MPGRTPKRPEPIRRLQGLRQADGEGCHVGASEVSELHLILLRQDPSFSILQRVRQASGSPDRDLRNDVDSGILLHAHPGEILGAQYLRRGLRIMGSARRRGGLQDMDVGWEGRLQQENLVRPPISHSGRRFRVPLPQSRGCH